MEQTTVKKNFVSRMKCFIAKRAVHDVLPYFALALILFIFGVAVNQWGVYNANRSVVNLVFQIIAALLGLGYIPISVLAIKQKVSVKHLIYYSMVVGLFVRLVYVCYTSVYDRQYDVWYIYDGERKRNFYLHHGHMQYIYELFSGNGLPDSNAYQFYHPPLWHLCSSFVLKVYTAIGFSLDYSLECVQLLSTFCSQATVFLFYKILKEMKVRQTIVAPIVVFAAVCPIMVVMAGTINNDAMMWMFFMATLLYLVRWINDEKLSTIIKMALCLGLGMMTKISCVMIAPIIAIVFLVKFIKSFKTGRVWKYIKQYACFGLISIPLGMWYPIRNMVLFEQPLNYVMRFKKNSELFCGNIRFLKRVFSIPGEEFFEKLFCRSTQDYSMFPYLMKSSIFEEHGYDTAIWAGWILFYAALVLAVVSFVCMAVLAARTVFKRMKGPQAESKMIFVAIWIVLVYGYLTFCVKYPFACTMDARYMLPAILIPMVFTMMATQELHKKNRRLGRVMHAAVWTVVLVYAVATVIFYINIK